MTKLQAIRDFAQFVLGEKIIIARDRFDTLNYAMDIVNPSPRLKLPQDLNADLDASDRIFRTHMCSYRMVPSVWNDRKDIQIPVWPRSASRQHPMYRAY